MSFALSEVVTPNTSDRWEALHDDGAQEKSVRIKSGGKQTLPSLSYNGVFQKYTKYLAETEQQGLG